MDSLNGIVAFVRTAETASFVAAARVLGVSASAVGKSVAKLEHALGVRLFQRTTRRVHLTAEGTLFFERCRRVLDDLDDAQAMLSATLQAPRGRLKVSLPTIGYRFLMPCLEPFMATYPDVELELDFSDGLVDLIDEGFDVVIRSGARPDAKLMSRRLGSFRHALCAASSYLERRGVPREAADLAQHDCVRYRFPATGKLMEWIPAADSNGVPLRLRSVLTCNNMEAVLAAVTAGVGIAYMPDFLIRQSLDEGAAEVVLPGAGETGEFWALWPSSRHLSPKIRVFVEFVATRLFV